VDKKSRQSFLLHCCCAPCTTHPIRVLRDEFDVTAFFYNPNIHPVEEYRLRQDELKRLAEKWEFSLILGKYAVDEWFRKVKGYEENPEGGLRCEICYRLRLEKTAQAAKKRGIQFFGTTLSVSPHKKADVINRIGKELEGKWDVRFYEADFKKRDGFKISCRFLLDRNTAI